MVFAGMLRPRSHGLFALCFALAGCASSAENALGPELGELRTEAAQPVSRAPTPAPALAPNPPADPQSERLAAPAEPDAEPVPSPVARQVKLEIEPPHAPGGRPRPSGEVAAAGDDELVARWNMGGNGDPSYAPNLPSFHPGARVVVDTKVIYPRLPKSAKGGKVLTQSAVLAQARSRGYWPFRTCYEAGLRERADLSGATRIRITIGARGGIAGARLLGSELGSASVAKCLVQRLRKLRFSPAPGRKVDVDVSIELWPGDAPLPERTAGAQSLDRELERALSSFLEARRGELESCYAAGLSTDPKLWGRIALGGELDEQGAIRRLEERESRFPDKSVVGCVERALSAFRFEGSARSSFVVALRFGEMPSAPQPPLREKREGDAEASGD